MHIYNTCVIHMQPIARVILLCHSTGTMAGGFWGKKEEEEEKTNEPQSPHLTPKTVFNIG